MLRHQVVTVSVILGMGLVLLRVLWGNIVGMYFGQLRIDPAIEEKLHQKHAITFAEVKEAVQWPAIPTQAVWETAVAAS